MKVPTLITQTLATGYIFTLKEGQPNHLLDKAIDKAQEMGGTVTKKYDLIPGFAVQFPDVLAQDVLDLHFPFVEVEHDGEVHTLKN